MTVSDQSAMTYHPSGRARWIVLLCLVAPILAVSLVMAAVLSWVFLAGWYLIILMPAVATAPVMYALGPAVGLAHCRNPRVAGLLGLAAGLTLYLGYYHVGMVHDAGMDYATRVDVLPTYINLRMHTDVVSSFPPSGTDKNTDGGDVFMNWLCFAAELAIVCGLLAWTGGRHAGRAYCETCGKWMHGTTFLMPGRAADIWPRIGGARMPIAPPRDTKKQQRHAGTIILLEQCRGSHELGVTCPAYVSLRELRVATGRGRAYRRFEMSPGTTRVRQQRLGPTEVSLLLRQFPSLASAK